MITPDISPVPLKACCFCGEYPEPSIDILKFLFTYECPHGHLRMDIDASSGTFTRVRAWNMTVDDARMKMAYALDRGEAGRAIENVMSDMEKMEDECK